jgi:hypothetical protein
VATVTSVRNDEDAIQATTTLMIKPVSRLSGKVFYGESGWAGIDFHPTNKNQVRSEPSRT